jgi:signal transduction histidine kinase
MEEDGLLAQLNIVKQCKRYGVSLWQCPQFLFVIMGVIIILTSIVSYLIGTRYIAEDQIVVVIVLTVALFLFVLSYTITRSFERVAEASRMKSEFINIVSHQLRSPLTNIKWTFEILSSDDFDVPESKQEEYFINVKENIARMVELIDDLLIVSRIEQGRLPIQKKEFNFAELVADQVSRYKIFAEATHIKLSLDIEEGLPMVFADPSLLKLVIENLIDNAIRYTPGKGGVAVSVKRRDSGRVLFSVRDSGVGIPEKDQKYIFQKFFRAENALKQRTKGSGLGLYVCKTIVEKSGGQIWFKSKEFDGTTFFVVLPIK